MKRVGPPEDLGQKVFNVGAILGVAVMTIAGVAQIAGEWALRKALHQLEEARLEREFKRGVRA